MGAQLLQNIQPMYNWLLGIMMPWGLIALFVLTFLESLYIIGLFTPGEVTVVAAALVAAGSKTTPVWAVLLAAWLGGLVGVAFGYFVGRQIGLPRIKKLIEWAAKTRLGKLIKLDPETLEDVVEYFDKHGVMTVFGARFAYGMKSFIPPIAGATKMSFWAFMGASAVGSLGYTTALVAVGWFLQQNVTLAGRIMESLGRVAGVVFVALFIFAFIALKQMGSKRRKRYMDKHGIPREDPRFTSRTYWKKITFLSEATSTNDVAFEAHEQGQKAPAAFIAYRQTAGRGRMQRTWASGEGGIYLSLLLPVEADPAKMSSLSLVVGLCALRAYRRALYAVGRGDLVGEVSIKWPNDIYLHDKKLAGILLEQRNNALVVGIGFNVRRPQGDEPSGPDTAIYLDDEGVTMHRKQLALKFLSAFESAFEAWRAFGFAPFMEEYTKKERNVGAFITLYDQMGAKTDEGYCLGFSESGALLLGDEKEAGPNDVREIVAGEISLRPNTD